MALRRLVAVGLVAALAGLASACDAPHLGVTVGDCVDTGRLVAVGCTDPTSDGVLVEVFRTTGPSPVPCPSATRTVLTSEGGDGPMTVVSLCLADRPGPS